MTPYLLARPLQTAFAVCAAALIFASSGARPDDAADATAGSRRRIALGLAASDNFTVWADSQPLAESLLAEAERLRREIAVEWLGEPLSDGEGHAVIDVSLSRRDAGRTLPGKPGGCHAVWIESPAETVSTTLAHEIAHVVLATRYPDLPAFAHEGIAGRYDGPARQALRRELLATAMLTVGMPSLMTVLTAKSIERTDQTTYTAAVSFTDFLLVYGDQNDAGHFSQSRTRYLLFALAGAQSGDWDRAVQQFYGRSNADRLNRAWLHFALDTVEFREPRPAQITSAH